MDVLRFSTLLTEQASRRKRKRQVSDSPESVDNPSYTAMIAEAIMITQYKRATLSEIYDYMNKTFDILKKRGTGWRNCVRHTLSLNECFVKLHRPENGRSCNWTIHQSYFEAFARGDYRKKRANRKKGKTENDVPMPDLDHVRSHDLCIDRLTSTNAVSNSLWQGYAGLNSGLHKMNGHYSIPQSYVYDQMYADERSRLSNIGNSSIKEEITSYGNYSLASPHPYADMHTASLRSSPYVNENHYSTSRAFDARYQGTFIDTPHMARSHTTSPYPSNSSSYRTQSNYLPFPCSRGSSQFTSSTSTPTSVTNTYTEQQNVSPTARDGIYGISSTVEKPHTLPVTSSDTQYCVTGERVGTATTVTRNTGQRYQPSSNQNSKQTCSSVYETNSGPVEFNAANGPCPQHYAIDPSCYSCFSTRPYRQEFF